MPEVTLSDYTNTLHELNALKDKKAAQDLQKSHHTDDTCICIPFFGENEQIKLLIPGPLDSSYPPENLNPNLRIIGANNPSKRKNLSTRIKHFFYQRLGIRYVRHINDLVGDTINLDEGRFIIIYKETQDKDNDSSFEKFIEKQNQESTKQFKEKLFSGKPPINYAEFLEKLSKLTADLKIAGGMTYFLFKEKDGSKKILRQTFKKEDSENAIKFLKKEWEIQLASVAEIKPHKYKDYHIIGFVRDWIKWTVFAVVTAIGAGMLLGLFVTPPLGTILAALVAVVTFIGISSLGFSKATKNNQTTIEFGTSELIDETQIGFISRIKNSLRNLFNRKSNKTVALSTENNEPEISTAPIGVFTTIVSSTSNIPVCNSNSMSSISALVNSSLNIFNVQKENECIQATKSSYLLLRK